MRIVLFKMGESQTTQNVAAIHAARRLGANDLAVLKLRVAKRLRDNAEKLAQRTTLLRYRFERFAQVTEELRRAPHVRALC